MKPKTSGAKPSRENEEVLAFLRELKHPLRDVVEAIREVIFGVSLTIREELKWNAPRCYPWLIHPAF